MVYGGKAILTPHETENMLMLYIEANDPKDLQKLASHILGEIHTRYKYFGVNPADRP